MEDNPARSLEQGAGPIVAKLLRERGIDIDYRYIHSIQSAKGKA